MPRPLAHRQAQLALAGGAAAHPRHARSKRPPKRPPPSPPPPKTKQAWLDPVHLPSRAQLTCGASGEPLRFLLQVRPRRGRAAPALCAQSRAAPSCVLSRRRAAPRPRPAPLPRTRHRALASERPRGPDADAEPAAAKPSRATARLYTQKPLGTAPQVYSPLDGNPAAFHRAVYVFVSPRGDKLSSPGAARALRCQLARENPYYAPVPAGPRDLAPPKLQVCVCVCCVLGASFEGRCWRNAYCAPVPAGPRDLAPPKLQVWARRPAGASSGWAGMGSSAAGARGCQLLMLQQGCGAGRPGRGGQAKC